MNLQDLDLDSAGDLTIHVPAWALGTVRRKSITFATGFTDDETQVVWVQAHGMTGDIRIHPGRPAVPAGCDLAALDRATLARLASVEGGVARTSYADGVMAWRDWIGFQPYDKYPEPGVMRRIGDCMIEFAPSGIYVEDWRFQPSAPGVLAGLTLVSEIDEDGVERRRQGGLVLAGDHAILSIARREELPEGTRAQDFVMAHPSPVDAAARVLDCAVEYSHRGAGGSTVVLATDPRREGQPAAWLKGFSLTGNSGILRQDVANSPNVRARKWRIESYERPVSFPLSTDVAAERLAWLDREADTLIAPLETRLAGDLKCA
ncbi:MAG: hypothetical protein NW216_02925 [Hyphomicrobium sp.]|nr:hypothetical protein [Hyphomicrobium sp.]